MERIGDWIQTFTGRQFYPLDPRPDDVDIRDIAHALSLLCRFAGHCRTFYSVAQHSVLVSENVPQPFVLQALLHDAAEAYIGDLSRPLKRSLRALCADVLDNVEDSILAAIFERFGVTGDCQGHDAIKRADFLLLATEARDLMAPLHPDWHHQEKNGWPVLPQRIDPLPPEDAEALFLRRWDSRLPTLGSLRGSMPGLTGGKSAVEFVRDLRAGREP